MNKKETKIIIAGPVNTGKSSILFLFKEFLKEKGIEYSVEESDKDLPTEEDIDKNFLEKKSKIIEMLKDKIKVSFQVLQTIREPINKING